MSNANEDAAKREGPSFLVTVPENYEQDEIDNVRAELLGLPQRAVGRIAVVREGVVVTALDPTNSGG